MSVVPACPGLFSVKMGGSSLQRPETKGTHGYTRFFLPSKPRARVTSAGLALLQVCSEP